MDSITQGLLGAAVAQLGFRQRIGRDATWVAAAAAVVPDLDILIAPLLSVVGVDVGVMGRIVIHRSYSHSVLVAPLLALMLTLPWWGLRRRSPRVAAGPGPPAGFGLLYACVLAAVLTQPLLDWFTSYGTQLWLPLTGKRYALDAVGIIDFVYTPLLILTLLGCYLVRRGAPGRGRRASLIIGWVGVLLTSGYLVAGRVMHDRALETVRARLGGEQVQRMEAYPMIGTILLWRVVAVTPRQWVVTRVHHLADPGAPLRSERVEREKDDPWIARALRQPEAQTFDWFADGMVRATHRRVDGRHLVELHDMRYGLGTSSTHSLWSLQITLDGQGKLVDLDRVRHHRRRGFGSFAGKLWHDIWNP